MLTKIKKPVSILLSLIMVFSLFTIVPFTVFAADVSFTQVTSADQITEDNIGTCTTEEAVSWILANWDSIEYDTSGYADFVYYSNNSLWSLYTTESQMFKAEFEQYYEKIASNSLGLADYVSYYQQGDTVYLCTPAAPEPAGPNDQMSVSIDDQIHLNLFLDLDFRDKTADDVTITFGGTEYTCEDVEKVTGGDYNGLYKFKVVMAPAQIADTIAVTIDGDADPLTTSVTAYIGELSKPEYGATANELVLARAMLFYGQAANNAFADGTTVLAADIANISGMNKDAVQNASVTFTDGTGAVTGASFMALTKPEFRFYTNGIDENTAYSYNQAGITATMTGSKPDTLNARFVRKADKSVLLEVTGVSAENMDKTITVTINGMEEGHNTITFNGNAFAKAMAKSSNTQQSNLGAALYNYGAAAKTCFGA